jgi:hypothetical protein
MSLYTLHRLLQLGLHFHGSLWHIKQHTTQWMFYSACYPNIINRWNVVHLVYKNNTSGLEKSINLVDPAQ